MGEKIRYVPPDVVADTVQREIQDFKDRGSRVDNSHHPSFPTLVRNLTASRDSADADIEELAEQGVKVPRIKGQR